MRMRDRDKFPTADRDGTYGCGRCGTFHWLRKGRKLACQFCKTAAPLIFTSEKYGRQAPPAGPPTAGKAAGPVSAE